MSWYSIRENLKVLYPCLHIKQFAITATLPERNKRIMSVLTGPDSPPLEHSFIFHEENYLITEMKNIIQILPAATPSYLCTAPVNRTPFTFTFRRCGAVVHIWTILHSFLLLIWKMKNYFAVVSFSVLFSE